MLRLRWYKSHVLYPVIVKDLSNEYNDQDISHREEEIDSPGVEGFAREVMIGCVLPPILCASLTGLKQGDSYEAVTRTAAYTITWRPVDDVRPTGVAFCTGPGRALATFGCQLITDMSYSKIAEQFLTEPFPIRPLTWWKFKPSIRCFWRCTAL